ncbi:MAG TPA: lipopolysaccharide transport periplasmic protein LptA [Zoogloea sp.]|uniref:lipopolysaccharide transport periplasmic protein LptA n=1 Tax=Zoogloea sp. TaxID=49181 RepID=UPI002C1FF981|nr:lipopolysaccharide transport periplasmic protein LptA [Zoogloea sp.]HMV62217.1 lipopolysaccharide transport periplasmic protein LptA [Rhodocyclaceae bacterium]HMW52255.1 lipopolysaccharide transport periplasmic protein LptA [Rhodocyclaceae bacterium]HMZ77773.1 lipopolysaccharide transport periplasmic protein LptA [Rhodocyclaceae bacterium]HNB66060.1 lipopolysaccharide transport periplasmic protein LptA [Rhodocyclaceae bacterium]HNE17275.1 lipopolysaccharide transport periplasmic protein Lpt
MTSRIRPLLLALAALIATPFAHAEKADRSKPVNIEADKVTVDDKNKIHIFEGHVILTQGTLTIRSDKLVVTQDMEGYQRGVATGGDGGLARFRQKRDNKDEWVDGEGERLEHDARTELSQFFLRARVKSGQDEVRGQYIQYNGVTETYLVTNGPNATTLPSQQSRVQVTLQPKKKD